VEIFEMREAYSAFLWQGRDRMPKKFLKTYALFIYGNIVLLKIGHFGKYIRNEWRYLKCDGGREGWRISVGPIV